MSLPTLILFGFVFLTSVWSLVCLRRNSILPPASEQEAESRSLLGQSRIDRNGLLTMTPPLEQLKAADF